MNIHSILERFISGELVTSNIQTEIDPDESLIRSGVIDSLSILRLIVFVEERFGLKVNDDEVVPGNFETINGMKALIEKKLKRASSVNFKI